MSSEDDYPLSAFRAALKSIAAWALVILTTVVAALWLGISWGQGHVTSAWEVGNEFIALPLTWLFYPQLLIAVAISIIAYYQPLRYESFKLRIVSAVLSLVAWLVIAAWVYE